MKTLGEIAQLVQGTLIGDPHYSIVGVSAISEAKPEDITFLLSSKYVSFVAESQAGAIVTTTLLPDRPRQIIVKNPRKALADILDLFFPRYSGYAESAQPLPIDPSAIIDKSAKIGFFSTVGAKTEIGADTRISNSVSIGAECKIGKRCVIYPQVVLYDHTEIGDDVIIHSGTVIGADGFGYYPYQDQWQKIAQIGRVKIASQVEIGAGVCIDRGCLGDTTIGLGTKIDNLVHIAHNVAVGAHCVITGQVGIMGSAIVEDHVTIGGQSGISSIKVGHHSTVAAKTGVTKDTKPHAILSGYPAWDHALELQKEALLRKMVKSSKGKK